jgi:C4-type Zn-finger protein
MFFTVVFCDRVGSSMAIAERVMATDANNEAALAIIDLCL